MGVIATDAFTRADAGTLGGNWTAAGDASMSIVSNQAASPNAYGTYHLDVYTGAGALSNDQYSEAVMLNMSAFFHGVVCRVGDAVNYYAFGVNPNSFGGATTYRLWKVVASTATSLGTGTGTAASGDLLYIEAQGTTIKGFANGVEKVSVTDSDLSSGYVGLVTYTTTALARFDDFECGDFAAVGGQPTIKRFGGVPGVGQGKTFGRSW